MRATLVRTAPENHNVTTFWFRPGKPVRYTAGQFIEMYLPHKNPDKRGQRHWFTLSSSPTDELISVTTKFAYDKSSTFKKTLFALKSGASVQISESMGDFVLPQDKTIPLVFVAAGVGITPFHSITKWLIDTREKRSIKVILAASSEKDLLFVDLFKQYGTDPHLVVAEHLTAEKILKTIGKTNDKRIYISGPEPMVETLCKDLEKLSVSKDQLIGDYFPGYSQL